ncbi:MAG TPA: potassium channel protein [Syntrophales bacterium]|nr:potassium channel protein [Syntrophales bacterium]HPQ43220.1 potassium channel protein [Syntrophales bacterium]
MLLTRQVKVAFSFLILIIVSGTVGYHLLEGWSLANAFYATIVTIGTVGFGDFYPVTPMGKLFAIFIIVFGVGTMAYTFAMIMNALLEGRFQDILGRGKLEKRIQKMRNHYIICGYGKIGNLICGELTHEEVEFVIVENNPMVIQTIEDSGYAYVHGNAAEDKTLLAAGIKTAKGVVCALPADADNLYVVLAAKELNPDVYVLSRFEDDASERRLINAGADRVISPYKVGGMRMSQAILRPAMLDFIEITTRRGNLSLRMEELIIPQKSPVVGKNLEESGLRKEYGLIVVAVEKRSGRMVFNPMASYEIEPGDKLIALGEEENLVRFSKVCRT